MIARQPKNSSILSLKVGHFLMHFPSRFSGLGKLARSLLVGSSVLSPWLHVTTVPTSVEPRAYTATIRVLTIAKLIFPGIFGNYIDRKMYLTNHFFNSKLQTSNFDIVMIYHWKRDKSFINIFTTFSLFGLCLGQNIHIAKVVTK